MEPGGKYIGHFTPAVGTSRSILQGIIKIIKFTEDNEISMESLVAIGCDGTNVNTGSKGGLITLMENIWGGHFTGPFVCCMLMSYLCDTCSLN